MSDYISRAAVLEIIENPLNVKIDEIIKNLPTVDSNKKIDKFINQTSDQDTEYSAGSVYKDGKDFIIAYEMAGAERTFSIGQPIYDKDFNIMGWLGIGLYDNLDYSHEGVRVPCEYWKICLPTKYCEVGKKVYTYWQMLELKGENK